MSLSIIIPTIGRPTLARTLTSLVGQLQRFDELIIVHDGHIENGTCKILLDTHVVREELHNRDMDEWWCLDGKGTMYHIVQLAEGPHEDWGARARNVGLSRASGDHILFMDDDDRYTPSALDVVRDEIAVDPKAILVFQMQCGDGQVLWRDQIVACGNVSTQMLCYPRTFRHAEWKDEYTGDFRFIEDLVALNPDHTLRWIPQVIALLRH